MAEAKQEFKLVEVEKVVKEWEEVVTGVTLSLTVDEAYAVKYLTGVIAGLNDFRAVTDSVYCALDEAGVGDALYEANRDRLRIEASEIVLPSDLRLES